MPAVSLAVDRAWITLADDLAGAAVVCGSVQRTAVSAPKDGELRHYAGNRTQGVVRDQDDRTLPYTLVHVSPAALERLISWRGQTVLLRTMDGQRFFAIFLDVPYRRSIGTTPDDDPTGIVTYEVDMIFGRVSYTEAT